MNIHLIRTLVVGGFVVSCAGALVAQDDLTLPIRLRSTVMIVDSLDPGTPQGAIGGAGSGVGAHGAPVIPVTPPQVIAPSRGAKDRAALLSIAVDRWSTDDETAALVRTQKEHGQHGLVAALGKTTVGHLQADGSLRWPIRWAASWSTETGRVIRLATGGPVSLEPAGASTHATDDTVGILEIHIPHDGPGEGTLVSATRAEFDDRGRIEAVVLAINSGTERLTNVEREPHHK